MGVTLHDVEKRFGEVWQERRFLPGSVTISEQDYEGFSFSVIPPQDFCDFEREVLGEARIAELDLSEHRKHISHIINWVNCGMVCLVRDPTLAPSTLLLDEATYGH
jgi:hypothetical protein